MCQLSLVRSLLGGSLWVESGWAALRAAPMLGEKQEPSSTSYCHGRQVGRGRAVRCDSIVAVGGA